MTPYIIIGILALSLLLNYLAGNMFLTLYKKTSQSTYSGDEVVQEILRSYNIEDVKIITSNELHQNYYHPTLERVQLGPDVYGQKTAYSVAIGAHEAMHAVDFNSLRLLSNHIKNINNFLFLPLLALSFFTNVAWIHVALVVLYATLVLFKIATETVDEFKMNRMAYNYLKEICSAEELKDIKRVYRVNSLTYVTNAPFVFA